MHHSPNALALTRASQGCQLTGISTTLKSEDQMYGLEDQSMCLGGQVGLTLSMCNSDKVSPMYQSCAESMSPKVPSDSVLWRGGVQNGLDVSSQCPGDE